MLQDLPTGGHRRDLCELFSAAFIEIRSLGLSGRARQAADLAEVVHETPREMWGWGGWDRQFLRQRLAAYQARYHGTPYEGRCDYVAMFDKIFGPPTEVLVTQIYVQLLNEGTVVYRPAPARELSTNEFEILRPDDYDPDDEEWEFPPGSVVKVALKDLAGKQVLVAVPMSVQSPQRKMPH